MKPFRIYIVEDEEILRVSLADDLRDAGYDVKEFGSPKSALKMIEKGPPQVVLSDIKMPEMDGMTLLRQIKGKFPEIVVLLMTAYGSVASAVESMKLGAYDYLIKPFQTDELLLMLDRIKELHRLQENHQSFQDYFQSQYDFSTLIGESEAIQKVKEQVKQVAQSSATVLITGETGTGKELLANIIQYNSSRRNRPLVKVSCAVLSRDVFESELFGHEKGSFTGAIKDRPGRFEMAHTGTIYLDDIDDIPLDLQVKLLRVLQEQEFERVGGNETLRVDVRTIASTKANLLELVKQGRFREDLYYRLNVFPIHLPPLRERPEDIPLLVRYFEKKYCKDCCLQLSKNVMERLQAYSWPGNVRELKNVVERLVLMTNCQEFNETILPPEFFDRSPKSDLFALGDKPLDEIMAEVEKRLIQEAMDKCEGNQSRAAQLLQIPASTLRSKLNKYGLLSEKNSSG